MNDIEGSDGIRSGKKLNQWGRGTVIQRRSWRPMGMLHYQLHWLGLNSVTDIFDIVSYVFI